METKDQDHQNEQPVNADQVPENAVEKDNQGARPERKSRRKDGDFGRRKALAHKGGDRGNARPDEPASEFVEKVLSIKRVTKVTKGGKKLSFSALVVVGDAKGNVGYGLDKAGEVATAIKKSLAMAKKNMIKISLKGRTIPHEIIGINGAAHVLLKPASEGTGVIASGPVRAVCDGVGIHDILTKCHRSNNPINVVKATINGLSRLKSVKRESPQGNHANP